VFDIIYTLQIIPLNNIRWSVFVMDMDSVLLELGTEDLYTISIKVFNNCAMSEAVTDFLPQGPQFGPRPVMWD
jgi:hypothetical protein